MNSDKADHEEPPFDGRAGQLMGGESLQHVAQHWRHADDAAAAWSDPTVDAASNDLHEGVGELCPRCGQTIRAAEAVRCTAAGAYQHEECEAPASA